MCGHLPQVVDTKPVGLLNGLLITETATLMLLNDKNLSSSSSPSLWSPVIFIFASHLDGGLLQGGRSCSLGGSSTRHSPSPLILTMTSQTPLFQMRKMRLREGGVWGPDHNRLQLLPVVINQFQSKKLEVL